MDAESNQPTIPFTLPNIPTQEQHVQPETAKENIRDTYVTRSGRKLVAPKRLDL